jgi:hypothetical protein
MFLLLFVLRSLSSPLISARSIDFLENIRHYSGQSKVDLTVDFLNSNKLATLIWSIPEELLSQKVNSLNIHGFPKCFSASQTTGGGEGSLRNLNIWEKLAQLETVKLHGSYYPCYPANEATKFHTIDRLCLDSMTNFHLLDKVTDTIEIPSLDILRDLCDQSGSDRKLNINVKNDKKYGAHSLARISEKFPDSCPPSWTLYLLMDVNLRSPDDWEALINRPISTSQRILSSLFGNLYIEFSASEEHSDVNLKLPKRVTVHLIGQVTVESLLPRALAYSNKVEITHLEEFSLSEYTRGLSEIPTISQFTETRLILVILNTTQKFLKLQCKQLR